MSASREEVEDRIVGAARTVVLFADERTGDQPFEDWATQFAAANGLVLGEDEDGDLVIVDRS